MHSKTAALLLIVALAMWQPHLSPANAENVTTEVSLYAHTDPSATSVGGRVLGLIGNDSSRHVADVRDGLAFTLIPSLSAPLRILGSIVVYVWLMSQQMIRGTLRVSLSEVSANASVIEIRTASVTTGVPSAPYLVVFGLGPVHYTVPAGSTLRLEIQFSPASSVPVMLVWDNAPASTRLVLKVESTPRISLRITDSSGRTSTIFPENPAGPINLTARVLVEDPFRGTNVQRVSLRATNSSGFPLVADAPMNLTYRTEFPFQLAYELPMTLPSGRFNVTVSVLDAAGRNFVITRAITITSFHRLILMLVDLQSRPAAGLNVSISAAGQFIDEVRTNSTGIAVSQVPSTRAVGPLTLQVRTKGLVILSQQIDVESDSTARVVAPLSYWNIEVRYEILNFPISGAKVDLYLNGTFLASNVSDRSGIAHFTSVPLGPYDIAVTSPFASNRFVNVTLSLEPNETVWVPIDRTVLILAIVAILAVFGVIGVTWSRRRRRRPSFAHFADLLGGTLPRSAVVMVFGPSGSGKTLLLQNMLTDMLELDRRCVYVSNSELPSKVKDQLKRAGVNAQECEDQNKLRFVDAYSGITEGVSREKHFVRSPTDLTALGIQLTSCLEELGDGADVFLDSITPIVASGGAGQVLDFVRYYGARTTKSGGTFVYVATPTIERELINRLEEASDCVVQLERTEGPGKIRGRLLVKKARGLEHERDWVGFRITSKGRMEFVSLSGEKSET